MVSSKLTWPTEATVYGAQIPFQPRGLMGYWNQVTPSDWADVLATFHVFSGVANRRLRKLVRHARIAEYGPGDIVVEQGSPGDSLYLILSGSAKVRGKAAARPLGIGDYFGELGLLDGVPRSATVVATGELQVMRIPRRSFLSLARRYPAISLKMASNLGRQLLRLEAQPA